LEAVLLTLKLIGNTKNYNIILQKCKAIIPYFKMTSGEALKLYLFVLYIFFR